MFLNEPREHDITHIVAVEAGKYTGYTTGV
jgi:hypothetical protein